MRRHTAATAYVLAYSFCSARDQSLYKNTEFMSSNRLVVLPQNDVHVGGVWKKSRLETRSWFPCEHLAVYSPPFRVFA